MGRRKVRTLQQAETAQMQKVNRTMEEHIMKCSQLKYFMRERFDWLLIGGYISLELLVEIRGSGWSNNNSGRSFQ